LSSAFANNSERFSTAQELNFSNRVINAITSIERELKDASGRRRILGVEGCKWAQENTGRKAQEYNAVDEKGAKEIKTLETKGRKRTKRRAQENKISRGNITITEEKV